MLLGSNPGPLALQATALSITPLGENFMIYDKHGKHKRIVQVANIHRDMESHLATGLVVGRSGCLHYLVFNII